MLTFAAITGPDDTSIEQTVNKLDRLSSSFLCFAPTDTIRWKTSSDGPPLEVIIWRNGTADLVQTEATLRIRMGWGRKVDGPVSGEYFELNIDKFGTGDFERNQSGVFPLYKSHPQTGCTVISNLSSLCATATHNDTKFSFDPKFLISCIGAGWPMFSSTLFDGVDVVKPGQEPYIERGKLQCRTPIRDPWWNQEFHDNFTRHPSDFWQKRIHELNSAIQLLFDEDGVPKFPSFSLSGGKDSRLLLAFLLQYPKFQEIPIRTSGSPYHSDVLIANAICRKYDLKHIITENVFSELDLNTSLPQHLFLTQGRTPPTFPSRWNTRMPIGTRLFGHEIGLRDPFPRAANDYSKKKHTKWYI